MPQRIIIDTDPGVDDAMAILFALHSPELEVVGLTAVFGNTDVEITAHNALRLLELEGKMSIPVAQGAGRPLVIAPRSRGKLVHGEDGLGGINLPPPRGKLAEVHAAQFIIETVLANPHEITLVPVGPLSNIALALRVEPKIADLVKEVVIMGGAAFMRGNASPVAEANIYNDPHAAAIVFSAGWQLTMVGLDVTTRSVMSKEYLEGLRTIQSPACDLISRSLPFYQDYHDRVYRMGGAIHTHDPSAIAYLIDPSLFRTERMPVVVETEGRCAGQTIPDPRRLWGDRPPVNICVDVDAPRLLDLFWKRISSDPV